MKSFLLIALTTLSLQNSVLFGQENIVLSGRVLDKPTGKGMSNVNILVKSTFTGTTTGSNGEFQIIFKDTGSVILEISRIGYQQMNIPVHILPGINDLKVEMQEQALYVPRVVVTASRREQDILESPVSISVLSIRSVKDRAIVDMEEALTTEPGISTVNGQLNIRGSSGFAFGTGNRSLVLIDNVPVLGSAAGNMTWNMVPTSEISQVEVVRSGGSTLYGSSALGGVINIITRMPAEDPETEVLVQSGFYSPPDYDQWKWREETGKFYTIQASHSRQIGNHGGWFRVQHRKNDGYTELGWEESINLTGKAKFNFNRNFSGSFFANYYKDETGLASQWKSPADPFEAPLIDQDNSISGQKMHMNSFFNLAMTPTQILKIKGSYFGSDWENTTAAKDFSHERRTYGEFQHSGTWSQGFQTTAGLVSYYSSIDARIFGLHDTKSFSGYILAQSHLGNKITTLAGIRSEWYWVDDGLQDKAVAPQIAVNMKQNDALSFRASYSRGFRVPSVAELFASTQLNVFKVEPNPNLKAEKSTSIEAGMTLLSGKIGYLSFLTYDMAIFSTAFNQLIEPTPDNFGIIHFENITDARITGMEMGLLASFFQNKFLLQSSYTYLDPVETDKKGNVLDTLSYRYRHTLASSVRINFKPFTFLVENRYSSRMEKVELFDENPLTGEDRRVPVKVWSVGINYEPDLFRVQLRVNNIFQYNYTELERNMAPGRAISLSVSRMF